MRDNPPLPGIQPWQARVLFPRPPTHLTLRVLLAHDSGKEDDKFYNGDCPLAGLLNKLSQIQLQYIYEMSHVCDNTYMFMGSM